MSDEPVRLQRREHAAILVIDRPDRMNSLSRATLAAFGRLGRELRQDSTLRTIVVTGAGERAFCAGADLKERQTMSPDDVRAQLHDYRSELGWLDHSPIPLVAAVNGAALGGGLELALMCDLRVAAEHATFASPEAGLAIIPGAGGTQRLPRLIGEARAKELILLGRRVTAAEALTFGLVNRVTPSGQSVLDDTLEWLAPILHGAPLAQQAALEAIRAASKTPLEQGLDVELQCYERCLESEDRLEALSALKEKRKPKYEGK